MANRNLTKEELIRANEFLSKVRQGLEELAEGDPALHFAYRRKIAKELVYDERGKPTARGKLKAFKRGEQRGVCAVCAGQLPEKGAVLDRFEALLGYTNDNTRLICQSCDTRIQEERGYQ